MRLLLLLVGLCFVTLSTYAQLTPIQSPPPRAIGNKDMVLQLGGQNLEILPNNRAIRQPTGQYSLVTADVSENFSKDRLGVAYSYGHSSNVMLSGEISFKIKQGASIAMLGNVGLGAKILVQPSVYVASVSTPLELVNRVKALQLNSWIDWVEVYISREKFD